jgi:5-methylcytosine-specific restriction endonuclease McrA
MANPTDALVRAALRRVWLYLPDRRLVLARCRVSRGVYRCENPECAKLVGPKLIQVDHIIPATPLEGIKKPEDWGIFIKNLLYCGVNMLMGICKECHAIKTKEENKQRKEIKDVQKKKTKTKRKHVHRARTNVFRNVRHVSRRSRKSV